MGAHDQQLTTTDRQIAAVFGGKHPVYNTVVLGPGINDAGIQQLIPVRGATTYDFSAYYKLADFEGAGGPQIVLRDAYTGAPLFASDPLNDAEFWKEVHSKVTIPNFTTLLLLAIERFRRAPQFAASCGSTISNFLPNSLPIIPPTIPPVSPRTTREFRPGNAA
jgi:hypothetical protein